jgi:Protein of unknown function (DUF2721)
MPENLTVAQLSLVISQVTAPAFLLGSVATFTSVLIARMNRIIDRSHALKAIDDQAPTAHLKADISPLRRRAMLLNKAILFSTISAITTSVLVILAFVSAYFNVAHEYGVGALFVVALTFFTASLINLARDTRIALHEIDPHQ